MNLIFFKDWRCLLITVVLLSQLLINPHLPALIWIPQWDSRQMEEPTVLVKPTISAPRALQYRRASRVSAVSPMKSCEKQCTQLIPI